MKTLTIKTPVAVTGIGFDQLNYIKIPIHRNNANYEDRLNFTIGYSLEHTDRIFIQGAVLVDLDSGGEGSSINVGSGMRRFAVTKAAGSIAYLYIPDTKITSLYFPYLNTGSSDSSLMAYFRLSDFPDTIEVLDSKQDGLPENAVFSFTITDSLLNLRKLANLTIFRVLGYKWNTNTPIMRINEDLGLSKLTGFVINQIGNGLDFDSLSLNSSPLLRVFEVSKYSHAKCGLVHFANKKDLEYFILRNQNGDIRTTINDNLYDVSKAANQLIIENANFQNAYVSTAYESSIVDVSFNQTNFSCVDADMLLNDLNNLPSGARRVDIPTRTTASDTVVASLESKGWEVVVWNGVVKA